MILVKLVFWQVYALAFIMIMKLKSGFAMVQSKNLSDKDYKIVALEITRFNELIKGHEKILKAIASL